MERIAIRPEGRFFSVPHPPWQGQWRRKLRRPTRAVCVSVHELGVDVGSHRCACRARCPLQLRPLPIAPPPVSQIPLSRIPYPGIPYPVSQYPVSRIPLSRIPYTSIPYHAAYPNLDPVSRYPLSGAQLESRDTRGRRVFLSRKRERERGTEAAD